MKLLSRSEATAQPWKNGGGRTWELATFPEGAGFEGMLWRLSMAEVARDGPFSRFEGIDRTLTVLSGGAMELRFSQGGFVRLDACSAPLAFPGEAAVDARVSDEPVIDLNIMTRRGSFSHRVELLDAGHPTPQHTFALFVREAPARLGDLKLKPGAVLLAENDDLAGLSADGPIYALTLRRHD
ncbi:HutD/Ves family protein [Thioclava electrotropha]|uniref:HutD family protein n=1 Tax=Thioclava electrotropha TaxID=1549850 RepID=A0ABX6YRP9_9RHOB|nr:HutD family protein [Thioclava electrotropha]QPZ90014.1 HutD family protein [Thioclava electrotropha]